MPRFSRQQRGARLVSVPSVRASIEHRCCRRVSSLSSHAAARRETTKKSVGNVPRRARRRRSPHFRARVRHAVATTTERRGTDSGNAQHNGHPSSCRRPQRRQWFSALVSTMAARGSNDDAPNQLHTSSRSCVLVDGLRWRLNELTSVVACSHFNLLVDNHPFCQAFLHLSVSRLALDVRKFVTVQIIATCPNLVIFTQVASTPDLNIFDAHSY